MLNMNAQARCHPHSERGHDLYETPACAVEALLRVEKLPHCVWEPACGRSAVANVLRAHGHAVIASDIYDYGDLHFVGDFLAQEKMPAGCDCIITNPPFRHIEPFVEHALELSPLVIMLARLAFLESQRRTRILEQCGLARVHIFRNRLPMLHRDGWTGPKASSAIPYMWAIWDRSHKGPATIHRLSWSADR